MAKPQKRKTRPNWFQKQIDQGGPDFLLRKQPLDIQRDAFNIIRDITRNNITDKDFEYLFNMKILSNVKITVFNKYIEAHVYDSSLSLIMSLPNGMQMLESNYGVVPENLQKTFDANRNSLAAYCAVLQALDTMIGFVHTGYTKASEDYSQIYDTIQYQLSRFRYII